MDKMDKNPNNDFFEIKPGFILNKTHIHWIQKIHDCIYFNQTSKLHMVCKTNDDEGKYYRQLNKMFFDFTK